MICPESSPVAADSIPRYGKHGYIFVLEGEPRIMATAPQNNQNKRGDYGNVRGC
jgi:hypothetical protein